MGRDGVAMRQEWCIRIAFHGQHGFATAFFARILGRDPVDHPDGISKDAPSLLQWNFATLTQAKRAHATLKAGLVTCNGYVLTRPCVAHCIQRPLAYAQALLDRADAETRIRVFSVDVPSLKLRGRRHTLPEIGTP